MADVEDCFSISDRFVSRLQVRPRPSSGRERSTDKGSSSFSLTVGITVFIVILVAFIVGFLIYRRHYSK